MSWTMNLHPMIQVPRFEFLLVDGPAVGEQQASPCITWKACEHQKEKRVHDETHHKHKGFQSTAIVQVQISPNFEFVSSYLASFGADLPNKLEVQAGSHSFRLLEKPSDLPTPRGSYSLFLFNHISPFFHLSILFCRLPWNGQARSTAWTRSRIPGNTRLNQYKSVFCYPFSNIPYA